MFKWKKILDKTCYPKIEIIIILTIISIFGLIYSFCFEGALPFLQYLFYAISAYDLTIICFRIPSIIKKIKTFSNNNTFIVKFKTDLNFRNKISLCANTAINTLFTLFYLIVGIFNNSLWFYSLSGYYLLFSIMRIVLLKDIYKNKQFDLKGQWLRYRFCGFLLVITNLSLAVIVFFVLRFNQGFSYHFIETIAIALFTFIITTLAIISTVKYRNFNQPLIRAIKFVSLSSALVSTFSLETAMLTVFGTPNDYLFKRIITTLTGTIVCLFILAIGIYMIIKSTKQLKIIKTKNSQE